MNRGALLCGGMIKSVVKRGLALPAAAWLAVVGHATTLFSTGLEYPEYDPQFTLAGQNGWTSYPEGGNGLVTNFFPGLGQQAYLGSFPPTVATDSLIVWKPLGFDPLTAGQPVVTFSVTMEIFDSSEEPRANRDCFRWSVYNTHGTRLCSLDFDNASTEISYLLDTGSFVSTGFAFERETGVYDLILTLDFAANQWRASLNGTNIVEALPLTTTNTPRHLGDISAAWVLHEGVQRFGDNFMVFDDYQVVAEVAPAEAFRLESLGQMPGVGCVLRLHGQPGRRYAIDATADFTHWTALKTNEATDGSFDYLDRGGSVLARRFYRGRLVSP